MTNMELRELEELREQFNLLNKKLENEAIVSRRLIRSIIRERANFINRKAWIISIFTLLFGLLFFPYMHFEIMHFSWPFFLFTEFFLFLAVVAEIYTHRKFSHATFLSENLVQASRSAVELKKANKIWLLYIGLPFLAVWFPWYVLEVRTPEMDTLVLVISISIGGALGALLGSLIYRKEQRMLQEIIDRIDDMEK